VWIQPDVLLLCVDVWDQDYTHSRVSRLHTQQSNPVGSSGVVGESGDDHQSKTKKCNPPTVHHCPPTVHHCVSCVGEECLMTEKGSK
jgi:hypothetical protein